ncbi:hypothetical protein N7467_008844 [Penicillium canescens]|nr:hypothetical protein N7467_008844 [Penicillium canescens]
MARKRGSKLNAPKTKDQLQQINNKDQTKQALFITCSLHLIPIPQTKQPRKINTALAPKDNNMTLCAQSIYNRKLTFLFRCKSPHKTRRRGTMIISRSPPTQGAGYSKGRARVGN